VGKWIAVARCITKIIGVFFIIKAFENCKGFAFIVKSHDMEGGKGNAEVKDLCHWRRRGV
jgi:hypothetical protein